MKTTWIPPIISKILGIKNVAGDQINPATEEKQDMLVSLSEMTVLLKSILISLQMPRNADPTNNADQVVVIGTVPVTMTSTTISALNGEQAHQMSVASEINAWANVQRSTIS